MIRDDEMAENNRMAELVAQTVVARLLDAAQDKETAARIIEVWGGQIDQTLGRGLRRALWYLFIALAGIAAVKFDLLARIGSAFK